MKLSKSSILSLALIALVAADFILWSQEPVKHTRWCELSRFSYDPAQRSVVSIVTSDNPSLGRPVPLTDGIDYGQIDEMVNLAVKLAGGLEKFIKPGTRRVVIKPNVVEPAANGNGANTDWRVVKSLILLLYRLNPDFEIVVAEGAGDWARPGTPHVPDWALKGTGYEISGYRGMIESLKKDPSCPGLKLRWVDLNYDEVKEVPVPEMRVSDCQSSFFLPRTVLDADFVIDVPVLKVHSAGITVALKNHVGLLPGMVYGWSKDLGYNGNNIRLDHRPEMIQKNIVDLVRTAPCDFAVVDCIVGKEKTKFRFGPSVRRNMIVAGKDLVSVDAVCSSLMDINPDDIEQITLAALSGLGQNDLARIEVRGGSIEKCRARFIKNKDNMPEKYKNERYPYYGQGNRVWLLSGPFTGPDMKRDFLGGESGASPGPGKDGWSRPIYFFDNVIDPAGYFENPADCINYAFTYLLAEKERLAELWLGSAGNMKVWVNGEMVYDYQGGPRRHKLPNEAVSVKIRSGLNRILVKVARRSGILEFSLNICEPESNLDYAGNRLWGARFLTEPASNSR
jgi:uncharacterized protein (DUF362 family)